MGAEPPGLAEAGAGMRPRCGHSQGRGGDGPQREREGKWGGWAGGEEATPMPYRNTKGGLRDTVPYPAGLLCL